MRYHIRFTRLARQYQEIVMDYLARQHISKDDLKLFNMKEGHILDFEVVEGKENVAILLENFIFSKYPEARILEFIRLDVDNSPA